MAKIVILMLVYQAAIINSQEVIHLIGQESKDQQALLEQDLPMIIHAPAEVSHFTTKYCLLKVGVPVFTISLQ